MSPRKKKISLIIFLLAVCLIVLNINSKRIGGFKEDKLHFHSAFSHIQSVTSNIIYSVRDFVYGFWRASRLLDENRSLICEKRCLIEEIARLKSYERENEELRKLLNFSRSRRIKSHGMGAEVIGRNVTNWYRTIVIDKGRKDGIRNHMVVVSCEGLVGKIVEVGSVSSRTMLILDEKSSISGVIERTGEQGIVEGQLTNILRMKYLPGKAEVKQGDAVRSSGCGGIYPEGLLIGAIKSVESDEYGLTVSAEVIPAVRFSRLENVLVIEDVGYGMK